LHSQSSPHKSPRQIELGAEEDTKWEWLWFRLNELCGVLLWKCAWRETNRESHLSPDASSWWREHHEGDFNRLSSHAVYL